MTFRKIDTAIWTDPWFEDLSKEAKLAFLYLWTNETCNQAGMYEISEKRIRFELGYGIDTILHEINTKVWWDNTFKLVWVRNFFKRQCQNHNFAISAINSINEDPAKLKLFIEYNRQLIESYTNKNGGKIIDLSIYHIDTIEVPYFTEAEQSRAEQSRADKKRHAPPGQPAADLSNKKSGHFENRVGEYYKPIRSHCDKILTFKNLDGFNPFKMVQWLLNQKCHLGAIEKIMSRLANEKYFRGIEVGPWPYAKSIMKRENGNFNERDAIKEHERLKGMEPTEMAQYTHGLLKSL